MTRSVSVTIESFPIAGSFTIARGSKTEAAVVVCRISDGSFHGIGECVPYPRYGESPDTVEAQIRGVSRRIEDGLTREELLHVMPAGAARNAIDCALWNLHAKVTGTPVHKAIGITKPVALETAYTLSLGSAEAMGEMALENSWRPLLKVKVGTADDEDRIRTVSANAPESRIILDANEGWSPENIERQMQVAGECNVQLIEQPLPASDDDILAAIPHPVSICADESVHTAKDLDALVGKYDAINIKLDKTGGLTAAIELRDAALKRDLGIMVGCMVGTSLSMAPAVLLAQGADYVDLDGPLLLARDRQPGLFYDGSLVFPPEPELWG